MPEFFESFDRFCRQQPGRIATWFLGALVAMCLAGATVVLFMLAQGVEIDRMARATDVTLNNHIETEKANQQQVMGALGSIDQKLGDVTEDLGYVKGRLGLPRSASGPDSVALAIPPVTQ